MSEREEGWYWVRFRDDWLADYWNGGVWRQQAIFGPSIGSPLEIGPRIPLPDEAPTIGTRYRNEAGEVVAVVVPAEADKDMVEHGMIDSGYCAGIGSAEEAWRFFLAALPEPD